MADADNQNTDSNSERSIFIDFLDPLFAVAIGIGFEHGLLLEEWLQKWRYPNNDERFNLFVFILGLLVITLSWFGYHKSIKKKPLEGRGRFIVDIVLLVLYILLLFKYKHFEAFLFFLTLIYLFFFFWDLLKIKEHYEEYSQITGFLKRYSRELITLQWLIIFFGTAMLHHWLYQFWSDGNHSLYFLIFAYIGTALYRIDKEHKILGKIFGWL
jgi:hypothetical protein